jgi:hypothetical protein
LRLPRREANKLRGVSKQPTGRDYMDKGRDAGQNEDGTDDTPSAATVGSQPPARAVDIFRPDAQTAPVVFASPHSGSD